MLSLLTRLMPGYAWLALLALALSIGGWVINGYRIDRLKAERDSAEQLAQTESRRADEWQARAEQRQADLEAAHQERREAQASVRQLQEDLATQDAKYRQLQQRIAQAPPEDDGPVAPVLRDAIRDLPEVAP
ncbi:DUF3450 family protein [Modicisalibacter sp. MOD 31.J]|uniref:DUF3450 family protein n=1 Tax=Modicisalibacter sp. MOD 31.J TaxID=2831897 RepID=UPI001CCD8AD2|nr:DUF3450 family protein [Modicisalibacter sp. MOD 31.J]MBZ9574401.1 hypothetical protein [Modicisalibacter sp. MOD 31.J]